MTWLRSAYRLALLTLVVLIGIVLAAINRIFSRRIYPPLKQRWFKIVAYCVGIRIEQHGFNNAYASQPGCLYVCNHISWADIIVIGACVPKIVFLSKIEVGKWPILGFLVRMAGTLFIQRGSGAEQINQVICQRLKVGGRVVIFPEGRTSTGETVKPFFPRLFKAAQLADASVQPLAIRYVDSHEKRFHNINFADEQHFGYSLLQTLRQPYIRAQISADAPLLAHLERNEFSRISHEFALKWVENTIK